MSDEPFRVSDDVIRASDLLSPQARELMEKHREWIRAQMWWGPGMAERLPMAAPAYREGLNEIEHEEGLYFEPCVGWRAWRVFEHKRKGLVLQSLMYKVAWPVRKPMRAHCMTWHNVAEHLHERFSHDPHRTPDHVHGCGIYSVKHRIDAAKWMRGYHNVIHGRVKVWGNVTVFSEGFLASMAYPDALVLPQANHDLEEQVRLLADRYGIEVIK